jgi:hypothetical protein
MKINKKVIVLLLILSLANIQSASFGFGMLKKSNTRKNNSNSSSKSNTFINSQAKNINSGYFTVSTSITKSKSVTTESNSSSSFIRERGGDIPDYSIYFNGWVKYLHYSDNKIKHKEFFKNTKYAQESRIKLSGADKDDVKYKKL